MPVAIPPLIPSTVPIPKIDRFFARELEGTGRRLNPPFTYDYSNPKSPLRAWVYD